MITLVSFLGLGLAIAGIARLASANREKEEARWVARKLLANDLLYPGEIDLLGKTISRGERTNALSWVLTLVGVALTAIPLCF